MNIIDEINTSQMKDKKIPLFDAGDTLAIHVKVIEGTRERIQTFIGIVIAKRNRGVNSGVTIRKISHGIGVERNFKVYSPLISRIEIVRRGAVRRAKLYYLRDLSGKAARIKEKLVSKKDTKENS